MIFFALSSKLPAQPTQKRISGVIPFETKSENNYDKIIFIQSPLEIRIERVIMRDNISREEVMKRINNQLDENLIIDKCDYVISNENKEDLEDKVLSIHLDLKA